jgi:hypothetical protein
VRPAIINVRFIAVTLVLLLAVVAAAGGWLWYNGQPDKLYDSAQSHYQQAEQLRGDPAKFKNATPDELEKMKRAYDNALARIDQFLDRVNKQKERDPRLDSAYMLRFKILKPLALIVARQEEAKPNQPSRAAELQDEAYRSAAKALEINDKNVEALAVMLDKQFSEEKLGAAYPYARGLIDNLPPDPNTVPLENFTNYVIGAYFILAAKDADRHPDQALTYLKKSLDLEKPKAPGAAPQQRWRAADLEIQALQKKVETASGKQAAAKADEQFKSRLQQYLERARTELGETAPAADDHPEMPLLASMSLTNTNGLIDVLLIGVQRADSHPTLLERADLLLQVCEKLANAEKARPYVYKNAAKGTTGLVLTNPGLPAAIRLTPDEMKKVQERSLAVDDVILKNGATVDPIQYLHWAHQALLAQPPNRARALDLIKMGLKAAGDQHLGANDDKVLRLQLEAGRLLLEEHKVKEAEEYFSVVGKQARYASEVAYWRGLGAVYDGRLEEGVSQLTVARNSPTYKDRIPLLMALQHAYMGLGQLENALPVLERLYEIRKREEPKNRDDQIWVELWQPTLTHATLAMLQCRLSLALRAARPQEAAELVRRANENYRELQKTFLGAAATAAVINYHLARLQMLEAKEPGSLQADLARQELKELINGISPADRNDPRLLWAEVNFILSEPDTNPTAMAAALVAPIGAPTDIVVRLAEFGRLRAGQSWQVQKAEQRIMATVAEQKDLATQLAWVQWLQRTGRPEQAVARLTELEDKARDDAEKRRLQAYRAELLLARGRPDEAHPVIEELLGKDAAGDPRGEVLVVQELLKRGKIEEARKRAAEGLSKYDQDGLFLLWNGQIAQSSGDYMQAIQSYERSMQFTRFRVQSENALRACVHGIADGPPGQPEKANPEAAFKEARRLRAAHPRDPVVLLTFAELALTMDQVYGDNGMEGALADMVKVLAENKATAANGPLAAARAWVAAGRPDRARQELKSNKDHVPSLLMATQLAVADEDWAEVADDLKALARLQPDAADLPLWRAALHTARQQTTEAQEIYTRFVEDHPRSSAGYLGLALLHEHAKEYKEVLACVKKWRDKIPDDLNAEDALVRVLARDGQVPAALQEADTFLKEQLQKVRAAAAEAYAKNPIKETDKEKAKAEADRRAKVEADALLVVEMELLLRTVDALQAGKAYAAARKVLEERVAPLIDRLPEAMRKDRRQQFQLARGALCVEEGRGLKEGSPERAKLMDQAIKDYDDVYKARPGHLIAGNNLAWLLVKEKGQPAQALDLIETVRKGKYSQQPISPDRLPLELLDTLGVVYRANGKNQESLEVFKEAAAKHYAKEPRVLMYLGLAQEAMGQRADAAATLRSVINLADERSKTTADPRRKEVLAQLITDAREEQKKIGLTGPR